jgi:ParB family chromosome partitioning protein
VNNTKSRLGRGLSALIPEKPETEPQVHGSLAEIEVYRVQANPFQPREEFDKHSLEELKNSIREKGVIQPITVRKINDHYELVAGERRLRAVSEIGHSKIPAYIINVESKEEMLEMALIENVQRERLNPIELANAFQRLIDECNLTQDEVAQKIGKDRTTIANMVRLLKLPMLIQESVKKGEISMGHARALLSLEKRDVQDKIWKKITKENMSVRKLEQIVKKAMQDAIPAKTVKPRRSIFIQKVEENLREILGTKVRVRSKKEGGSIEVDFYSPEDLNRLIELFEKINTQE